MHPAQLPIDELLAACKIAMLRRGGPGGQHRNKVETAVSIEHLPTGISAEASERRSQADNRRVALHRLRLALAINFRIELTEETNVPSLLWASRRQGSRISVSTEHDDFPALLSELLDHLNHVQFDLSSSSIHFSVTASQLVSLLRSYAPAWVALNSERAKRGLGKLK